MPRLTPTAQRAFGLHAGRRITALACLALGLLAMTPASHASEPSTRTELHVSSDGKLDLSPWKGQVVYVDFFASWCGPCKQSFPWMMDVQQRFKDKGFVVLGINVDKDKELADKFLKQFRPTFPIVFDSEGRLAEQMKVEGMPSSLIFDRDGKVRFVHTGFRIDERLVLEDELRSLLH